jgi:hypothetical protein
LLDPAFAAELAAADTPARPSDRAPFSAVLA